MDLAPVDQLLTTTMAVKRRLDLSRDVKKGMIEDYLKIAIRAPIGANMPKYHVLLIDPDKKARIAHFHRQAFHESYLPRR